MSGPQLLDLEECAGTCRRIVRPRGTEKIPGTAVIHARGMCQRCYQREMYRQRTSEDTEGRP